MTAVPYWAMPQDTAEFMLGKVAVTPVFLESNGLLDPSTEDWTPELIQTTLQTVQEGLDWWVDLLAAQQTVHTLEFALDTTYALTPAPTRYEPISRPSNDFAFWVQEFITARGFDTVGGLDADMRAFNDAQRQKLNADWAYTMFVVNSAGDANNADGAFAPTGSFPFAFAFPGGLFLVSPSSRPASTFAHETGHMFWGKDEYAGGGSYSDRRGYYNAQNTNAADNPEPGFVQQPSIMASGSLLDTAFENHISPASTLAMIGWRDSDSDGIFDVLDVPLELTGTGHYDSAAGAYRFRGAAKVGVLPNLNSEGLRNDITLNRVSSIQYRIDDGNWLTADSPDAYEADLDLSIPLGTAGQTIQIRAIDAATGITSNVFQGRLTRADAVSVPGINGFVWIDSDHDDQREAGEFGEAGWTVEVLSSGGQPLDLRSIVDPETLTIGELDTGSVPGVSITAIGSDSDGRAGIFSDPTATGNPKLFQSYSRALQSWRSSWTSASRRMQIEFATPTSVVEMDAIATSADSYGRIEAYDAAGNLLDRFTTPKLANGQTMTMRVESAVGAIASVRIGGHANTSVRLDNLRFGPQTQVTTGEKGQFSFPGLPSGDYVVKVTAPESRHVSLISGGELRTLTATAGNVTSDIDFGFRTMSSAGRNPREPLDVNDDHLISALDVLLIVNEINANGPHELSLTWTAPPFIDVNGDWLCSALDALLIVNQINANGGAAGTVAEAEVFPGDLAATSATTGWLDAADSQAVADDAALGRAAAQAGAADGAMLALAHDEALRTVSDAWERFPAPLEAFFSQQPDRRSTRLAR